MCRHLHIIASQSRGAFTLLLRRRGLLPEDGVDPTDALTDEDATLAQCYTGVLRGAAAFGPQAGRPAPRLGRLLRDSPPEPPGPRCARSHGFNLHANVTVREGDRPGLERLCRYLARAATWPEQVTLTYDFFELVQ